MIFKSKIVSSLFFSRISNNIFGHDRVDIAHISVFGTCIQHLWIEVTRLYRENHIEYIFSHYKDYFWQGYINERMYQNKRLSIHHTIISLISLRHIYNNLVTLNNQIVQSRTIHLTRIPIHSSRNSLRQTNTEKR